jgi:hypothetical protein
MPGEMIILGQTAGSVNEYNVYLALIRAKHFDISYQYPIDGGRSVRGGQVIDFVDWGAAPNPVAIYVQGERWHRGKFALEEAIKQARAEKMCFEVVEVWEHESETQEAAYSALKEKYL